MAKIAGINELVRRISELRQGSATDAKPELSKHLTSNANLVVAKAAEVIGALRIADLSGELEQAFARFMDHADDKGCLAKTAIAKALNDLGTGTDAVFLRGVRHVQMEATWGGSSDVAGDLRATSGLALASIGSRDALTELSDLLMDPLPGCRIAAARALAHTGHESAALPLRVKLLAGDEDIAVTEECLASLVKLTPRKAVPFAARLLDDKDDEIRGAAMIALGMTRTREGLDLLLSRWTREITPDRRQRLLPAIALARLPEAVAFLIKVIDDGPRSLASDAIDALAPYRHDSQVRAKVAAAVTAHGETGLRERFETVFGR